MSPAKRTLGTFCFTLVTGPRRSLSLKLSQAWIAFASLCFFICPTRKARHRPGGTAPPAETPVVRQGRQSPGVDCRMFVMRTSLPSSNRGDTESEPEVPVILLLDHHCHARASMLISAWFLSFLTRLSYFVIILSFKKFLELLEDGAGVPNVRTDHDPQVTTTL